jgi:multicomponent K+:H+ antiporter subunit A
VNDALLALALLPFAGALLPVLAHRTVRADPAWSAGVVAATAFAIVLWLAPAALDGGVHVARWSWVPALGLEVALRWDGLAFLFALLITAIGTLVVAYSRWYLEPHECTPRFYGLLLTFMGAMLGVVLAENLLLLVVAWELTSLASFLLIGFRGGEAASRQGARLALLVTGLGGLALLAGLLLLADVSGGWTVSAAIAAGPSVKASTLYPWILGLVLVGAFTKSAQFPFHVWLPHAMAAPTPVSAYLHSATMVKAGIFLLMRFYPALGGTSEWFWTVATTGTATLLFASGVALYRHDLKGLLAYSTISHLGLIVLLMGIGTPLAEVAAVFHVINHAVFKASLFMAAGIVDHGAGTRDMRRLSGLARFMPYTATLAIIASASMAGVPLLNGFLSKEMFFAETLARSDLTPLGWLFPAAATLAGVFTVAYSTRFVHDVFFGGAPKDLPPDLHEAPRWLLVPMEVLVVVCLLVGLLPGVTVEPVLRAAAAALLQAPLPPFEVAVWHGPNAPFAMSLIALAGGAALYFYRRYRGGLHDYVPAKVDGKGVVEGFVASLQEGAALSYPRIDGESLRRSLFVLLAVVVLFALLGGWHRAPLTGPAAVHAVTPVALGGAVLLVAATIGTVVLHRRRHVALVTLGVVGLVVALAFAQFSAPDLALTQLLVEIVTLLLLLLALRWLPEATPPERARSRASRDAALALLVGAGAAALAWAMLTREAASIADYYVRTAPGAGGGRNVVNVILVDFRGFDTLGEITVLGIGALAIAAMLGGLRLRGRDRDWLGRPWHARAESPLLRAAAPPVLALSLVFAAFLFLRGHDQPGGGFVAGLVTGIALFLQYVAFGAARVDAALRIGGARTIAAGVGLATLTGVGSFAFDHPFLTSSAPYVPLPLLGPVKLPTATFFDLGVYVAVVGTVLRILSSFVAVRETDAGAAPAARAAAHGAVPGEVGA